MMDGILPVYKPAGVTSADVVSQVRYLLQMRKVGHAGTLDPSVDGVLPIALGAATKAVPALMRLGKTYTGSLTLGLATETEDMDGDIIEETRLPAPFSDEQVDAAIASLTGKITQIPPMYSAVKVNGRRLYEYARNGETVDRPKREATIYRFERSAPTLFDADTGQQTVAFVAEVSKGTYIRTLTVDVGRALGVPAVMKQLTRTKSGGFTLEETLDLRPLDRTIAPEAVVTAIRPIQAAFPYLPLHALSEAEWARVQNGNFLTLASETAAQVGLTQTGVLKAVYQREGKRYRPDVMFLANTR